jgi:hypothetical protein
VVGCCGPCVAGVWWDATKKRWGAQIEFKNQKLKLGYFTEQLQAAQAYDAKARELKGDKVLSFPNSFCMRPQVTWSA